MEANSWRSAQGDGPAMDSAGAVDWRSQLLPEARQRIVNRIMEDLKRHLPISVPECLNELKRIAARFEEKIYSVATSQQDYLRKISLKILSMVTKAQHTSPINPTIPNSGVVNRTSSDSVEANSWRSAQGDGPTMDSAGAVDWRSQLQPEARQRIINKIMEYLKRHLPISVPEGLNELKKIAVRFEENIYSVATSQLQVLEGAQVGSVENSNTKTKGFWEFSGANKGVDLFGARLPAENLSQNTIYGDKGSAYFSDQSHYSKFWCCESNFFRFSGRELLEIDARRWTDDGLGRGGRLEEPASAGGAAEDRQQDSGVFKEAFAYICSRGLK